MSQEDYFTALAHDFPNVSPLAMKRAKEMSNTPVKGGESVNMNLNEELENEDPSDAAKSAKKARINRRKKERKLANRAMRDRDTNTDIYSKVSLSSRRVYLPKDGNDVGAAVQDALGILQDDDELDESTYRRLSTEKFTTDSLRRLSECGLEVLPPEDLAAEKESGVMAADKIDVISALRAYITLLEINEEYKDIFPQITPVDASYDAIDTPLPGEPTLALPSPEEDALVDVTIVESLSVSDMKEAISKGNVSIKITDRVQRPSHVDYCLELMVISGDMGSMKLKSICVNKRYSELQALNNKMSAIGCRASFPPRQWFW